MGRLIDTDELIANVASIVDLRTLSTKTIGEAIAKTPTVDAVPVVHGHWTDDIGIEGAWNYCSVCGERAIDLYDYCPNCGAKMDGKDGEHEID